MYYVKLWRNDETVSTHTTEAMARAACREIGHTGEDWKHTVWYPPVAYVANDRGECVYNPRFRK